MGKNYDLEKNVYKEMYVCLNLIIKDNYEILKFNFTINNGYKFTLLSYYVLKIEICVIYK